MPGTGTVVVLDCWVVVSGESDLFCVGFGIWPDTEHVLSYTGTYSAYTYCTYKMAGIWNCMFNFNDFT